MLIENICNGAANGLTWLRASAIGAGLSLGAPFCSLYRCRHTNGGGEFMLGDAKSGNPALQLGYFISDMVD